MHCSNALTGDQVWVVCLKPQPIGPAARGRIALNHRKAVLDHIAAQQEYLKAVEAKIAHYRNQ